MADADKVDSSTSKAKTKSSFLDEDISNDFLSSWKSMPVTGGDDMDFNFEPVAKGKKKAFDFGMDMDFSLDDAFGKMPSFKLDMPDIDFSSSPKKSSNSKDKITEGESGKEIRQEKNDKFTFSFDFNGDGDNNDDGEIRTKMVVDALPSDGQAKKDALDLLDNRKTSIDVKSSGDDPSNEGNGQRLQDNPRSGDKELVEQDSTVEKREKNADASRDGDNNEKGEIRTKMVVDSVPHNGQAEKDKLHLLDSRKMSVDGKSRDKESSFVEVFGKLPELKLDMPKKSSKFKENLSEESSKGNHQEQSNKLTSPLRLTEETNGVPVSVEVVGVVESLDTVNLPLDTADCFAANVSKTMNSEVASKAETQKSGLKDSPLPSDSEPICAKPIPTRYQVSGANNISKVQGTNNGAEPKLLIKRKNQDSTPLVATDSSGDPSSEQGRKKMDNKYSGTRLTSLVAPKGVSKSSNQGNEKLKGRISSKSTVQQSNVGQSNRLPSGRIDKIMPSLPNLSISRNITPNKQSFSLNVQDLNSVGNHEKSPKLQVKSRMVLPVNVQKQTPSMPSLKRKPAEAADLYPSKRLSPSDSRKSKISVKEAVNEVQTQGILVEGSKTNVTAENLSPKFDFCLEANVENLGFMLMVEGDVNVEKAEACAKELEEICSMLKKKHDEAKELLVRALINNNNLLMLNYPICDEKIRDVQRFASRLMSREQAAGV